MQPQLGPIRTLALTTALSPQVAPYNVFGTAQYSAASNTVHTEVGGHTAWKAFA